MNTGVRLSSFNSVPNPSTWDVSPTFKVTLLSSLEIPFQTWPKLHPLSDSKPRQADNEEHSFSTEGRLEVEMLQLPCSLRPVSALGPVVTMGNLSNSWGMFPNMLHSSPATFLKEKEGIARGGGPHVVIFPACVGPSRLNLACCLWR